MTTIAITCYLLIALVMTVAVMATAKEPMEQYKAELDQHKAILENGVTDEDWIVVQMAAMEMARIARLMVLTQVEASR